MESGEVFLERIERGALIDTLAANGIVKCTVNHDESQMLGDTRSNMKLRDEPDGLHFELTVDNDRATEMIEGIRQGYFNHCSFTFTKIDFSDEVRGGMLWRTVKKLELHEVCLTDSPAYTQTNAEAGCSDNRGLGKGVRMARLSGDNIQYAAYKR